MHYQVRFGATYGPELVDGNRLQTLCRCSLTSMLQYLMLMLTTAERWYQHPHSKLN